MTLLAVMLIAAVAAAILISMAFINKAKVLQTQLKKEASAKNALEDKLGNLRRELSAAKEDLAKRTKLLEEARDSAKRKLRKDAAKQGDQEEEASVDTNSEAERLKRALHAMEAQLRSMQHQSDRAAEQARQDAKNEFDKQLNSYKEEINKLNTQLGRRQHEAGKQKQALKESLPTIDIDTLPDNVTQEMARLLRKADQYEKMHGVTHGKLQMSQERYAEMQKRYFAVCRELALAAGRDETINDETARNTAEDIIAAAETHHAEMPSQTQHVEDDTGEEPVQQTNMGS